MFDILDNKVFMDSVHGYISIPRVFVENLIDTELFQRLHNITQTGMGVLYPNGKHDRYSHTLGVYHLGLKAVNSLLDNFSQNMYWKIRSDDTCDVFWAKNKILFLIACLLHDIGHTPYSHSLENVVLENSSKLKRKLADNISNIEKQDPVSEPNIKAAPHEIIGSLLIFDTIKPHIKAILDYLNRTNYPNIKKYSLSEYVKKPPTINSDEIDTDICFIVRMITGLKYTSYEPEKQIQNCFIELLNGKNFDVDKLDYIIRDTRMSGIANINIDVERLINSLTLVTITEYLDYTFENYNLDNVFIKDVDFDETTCCKISGYFDGVIQLKKDTFAVIEGNSEHISLKPSSFQSHQLRSLSQIFINDYADFEYVSEFVVDGNKVDFDKGRKVFPVVTSKKPQHFIVRDAKVVDNRNFCFQIVQNEYELHIKGHCIIEIRGKAKIETAKFSGTLDGKLKKMSIIGDLLSSHKEIPTKTSYNSFSIGFKKQAINILSNVLEARDYLYLWIYAHHKVIYYANFLIPFLSKSINKHIKQDSFPNLELTYESIENLDDAYFCTALRFLYTQCKEELDELEIELLKEFFSRKYKKTLYKSLAEYDLFFDDFTNAQKNQIKGHFDSICSENMSTQKDNLTYGVVPQKILDEINTANVGVNLKNLIWVSASYSHKILNQLETYCVFSDQTVTMKHLNLFTTHERFTNKNTNHYFYLYYSAEQSDNAIVKHAILEYLKNIVNST